MVTEVARVFVFFASATGMKCGAAEWRRRLSLGAGPVSASKNMRVFVSKEEASSCDALLVSRFRLL